MPKQPVLARTPVLGNAPQHEPAAAASITQQTRCPKQVVRRTQDDRCRNSLSSPEHVFWARGAAGRPGPARAASAEEGGGFLVAVEGDGVELAEGLGEGDAHDVGAAHGDHLTPGAVHDGVGGVQAEARGQHAVEA